MLHIPIVSQPFETAPLVFKHTRSLGSEGLFIFENMIYNIYIVHLYLLAYLTLNRIAEERKSIRL